MFCIDVIQLNDLVLECFWNCKHKQEEAACQFSQKVDDKDKTLPLLKVLPKEVLQLKCQARNHGLYDSYYVNVGVIAPGAKETEAQPESEPPPPHAQPPNQPTCGLPSVLVGSMIRPIFQTDQITNYLPNLESLLDKRAETP